MKTTLNLVLLAGMLASFALPAAAQKADRTTEQFKARIEKAWAGWDTMDPANVAPYYAQEAGHLFFDVAPLKYDGWSEYAAGVKKVLADYASLKLVLGPDLQVHQHGSLAWTTATFRLDGAMKSGAQVSYAGRWTAVWEKHGKEWLIVHEHTSVPLGATNQAPSAPLYVRLGGYDALAAVTDDFLGRLIHDPQLSRFFGGVSADSQKRIRQLVVDQLCAATGGPCYYTGRSMKTAHAGLGISEPDWQLAVGHLVATLDKFQVPAREREEVLSAISGVKSDIVTGEGGMK